jgi:hypothetical protein
MFFDVIGRLDSVGYIRHRVTRVPIFGPADIESLAQLSCYIHGSPAVPAWMDYLSHVGEAHDVTTKLGRQRESSELFTRASNMPIKDSEMSFVKSLRYLSRIEKRLYPKRSAGSLFSLTTSQTLSNSVSWPLKSAVLPNDESPELPPKKELNSVKSPRQQKQPIYDGFGGNFEQNGDQDCFDKTNNFNNTACNHGMGEAVEYGDEILHEVASC